MALCPDLVFGGIGQLIVRQLSFSSQVWHLGLALWLYVGGLLQTAACSSYYSKCWRAQPWSCASELGNEGEGGRERGCGSAVTKVSCTLGVHCRAQQTPSWQRARARLQQRGCWPLVSSRLSFWWWKHHAFLPDALSYAMLPQAWNEALKTLYKIRKIQLFFFVFGALTQE